MASKDKIKAQIAASCRTQKLKVLKYAGILSRLIDREKDLVKSNLKIITEDVREDIKERYYANIYAIERTVKRNYDSVLFKHLAEISKSRSKEKVSPFYCIEKVLKLYKAAVTQLLEDIQIKVLSSEAAVNLNFKLTRRINAAFVPADFPELKIVNEVKELKYFSHINIWHRMSVLGNGIEC